MATIKTSSGRKKAPKKSAPKQKVRIIFREKECDKEHGEVKLQEKTVTENGTVTPDPGFDGLSRVNVNVSGGSGGITKLYAWKKDDGEDTDPDFFTLKETISIGDNLYQTSGKRFGTGYHIESDGVYTYISPTEFKHKYLNDIYHRYPSKDTDLI